MEEVSVRDIILYRLYEARFDDDRPCDLNTVREEVGWEAITFWRLAESMIDQKLLSPRSIGRHYRITTQGILFSEDNDLVPEEEIYINQKTRSDVLEILAKRHNESVSIAHRSIPFYPLADLMNVDSHLLLYNIKVLEDSGYIESVRGNQYRITQEGLVLVEDHGRQCELVAEFESIRKIKPHARGRALERLVANVFQQAGWATENNVRTSSEEIDLVIHRDREYSLVECKWLSSPVEAKVIRELYGKLSNRANVSGMMISMCGYTSGACNQVKDYARDQFILLFGPKDMHSMIYHKASLDELINEKHDALITRRQVKVS